MDIFAQLTSMLASLSPLERWHAARGPSAGALASLTLWGPILAVMVVGIALVVTYRYMAARRERLAAFIRTADQLGLTREERATLAHVALAAKVRHVDAIYSLPEAFETGLVGLKRRRPAGPDAAAAAERLDAVAEVLREKLGFGLMRTGAAQAGPSEPSFAEGTRLTVERRRAPRTFQATVVRRGAAELTVDLDAPVDYDDGELWELRYGRDGFRWEAGATVAGRSGGRILLRLTGTMRRVNRRRFVRVPVRKKALLVRFPLLRSGNADDLPESVPVVLTQIGGPGLRLQSRVEVKEGERVLIVANVSLGRVVQCYAKVRAVSRDEAGVFHVGVEIHGLDDSEIGQLVQETNTAARRNRDMAAGPAPLASATT